MPSAPDVDDLRGGDTEPVGGTCHGADYSWRVDTVPSYDFLLQFVD